VKALDRKLLRDLRLMWSQVLTIALVVASGVGGFITTLSAVDSLTVSRDRFYESGRFADVFASVKRAPNALVQPLLDIPGIADVQTTVEQVVRIELPGVSDPVVGQLIGVDPCDCAHGSGAKRCRDQRSADSGAGVKRLR
jgi:putative ABC transport system permease protein